MSVTTRDGRNRMATNALEESAPSCRSPRFFEETEKLREEVTTVAAVLLGEPRPRWVWLRRSLALCSDASAE